MFRHIRAGEENVARPADLERVGIDLELLKTQLTPFNCEARAYGRLQETNNTSLAWRCYGYIALDEQTYGSVVRDKIGLPRKEWFAQTTNGDAQVADRLLFPIYALVKEFIPEMDRLGQFDIDKVHNMAQAINEIHRVGIAHRDMHDRNYVDSRLMDFSTSWTVPNVNLDRQLGWETAERIDNAGTEDYFVFDQMIERWNAKSLDRTSPYRMTSGPRSRTVPRAPRVAGDGQRAS